MRVLFSSTWGYGHVLPMVPLAQACVAAGHDVLWAAPGPAEPMVRAAGIAYASAGLDERGVGDVTRRNRSHVQTLAPENREAFAFPNMFGAWTAPAMAAQLLPLARGWRPDVLVHEPAEFASPLVGALLGAPVVTHSYGSSIPLAILAEVGNRVAGLWSEHHLTVPPYAGCFGDGYLDLWPPSLDLARPVEIPLRQPLRAAPWTGPSMADSPSYLQPDERPLIYLTLGTVQNLAPVLRTAVAALGALPVRVLATVGPNGDPDALGTQPPNVTIERWVQQSLVLSHCAVVVSHAGSGTFLGTLAAGLPQLCLPQSADQFRNANAGVRRGAALALGPDLAPGEAVAAAVNRLLDQPSFRNAAEQVAAEIAAMPSPADVVQALPDLAASRG